MHIARLFVIIRAQGDSNPYSSEREQLCYATVFDREQFDAKNI